MQKSLEKVYTEENEESLEKVDKNLRKTDFDKYALEVENVARKQGSISQAASLLGLIGSERERFISDALDKKSVIGAAYQDALNEANNDMMIALHNYSLSGSKDAVKAADLLTKLNHEEYVNNLKEDMFGL